MADEFGDIVSENRIEQVAKVVEKDGNLRLAPGPDHPDRQRAQEESTEKAADVELDEAALNSLLTTIMPKYLAAEFPNLGMHGSWGNGGIVKRLDQLEAALGPAVPFGIGHNRPPADGDAISAEELRADVLDASGTIRDELGKAEPTIAVVAEAASRFQRSLNGLGEKRTLR